MAKKTIQTLSLISFLLISLIACVDLEFDTPPIGGVDPNLPVNITIAELKARHQQGMFEEITDDVTFTGIVISDDAEGNFFKQLVIADETAGIEMRIEMNDLHNIYPVGRKVYVKAKGLWLGDYNGLTQLGAAVDLAEDELIRIPESLVANIVIPATYGNPVVPKTLTIDELTLADVSTLIKLEGVQFVTPDAGETWADPVLEESVNREIEDCSRDRLIVRTSGFASFAGDLTPEGNGTIVGILGIFDNNFNNDFQLFIRDLNDVMMTGSRCAVTINESFTEIPDDEDIMLPEWSNIAVKGSRLWRVQVFSGDGNHYAQATAYNDPAPEMEAWLITPGIVLDVPKKITFETAKAFYTHPGLSVWISTDFNGSNVTQANWQPLPAAIADVSSSDHAWIPSGNIDLSGYTGTVYVGFKYVGSSDNEQTTTYRVDNVKVDKL